MQQAGQVRVLGIADAQQNADVPRQQRHRDRVLPHRLGGITDAFVARLEHRADRGLEQHRAQVLWPRRVTAACRLVAGALVAMPALLTVLISRAARIGSVWIRSAILLMLKSVFWMISRH